MPSPGRSPNRAYANKRRPRIKRFSRSTQSMRRNLSFNLAVAAARRSLAQARRGYRPSVKSAMKRMRNNHKTGRYFMGKRVNYTR